MITEIQHDIYPDPHPDRAAMEATLATGALVARSAGAEPGGSRWRVRIFEYGLSRNRYRAAEKDESRKNAATAPLRWTRRSAQAALRHLDGAGCFAGHGCGGSGQDRGALLGFFSEPAVGSHGPEATLTLRQGEN